jgi:hypothetical protein
MRRIFIPALLLAVAAFAENSKNDSTDRQKTGWYAGNRIMVQVIPPAQKLGPTFTIELGQSDDASVVINDPSAVGQQETRILLVAGRWMVTKGLIIEPGYEIDALDGPVLVMQTVTLLLDKAVPAGPDTIQSQIAIDLIEKLQSLRVNTQSAEGEYPAPWQVKGTVVRRSPTIIAFDLNFVCKAEDTGGTQSIHYAGTWERDPVTPALSEQMSLKGWQVFWVGPSKRRDRDGATIIDYGAQQRNAGYATLADLRKASQAGK